MGILHGTVHTRWFAREAAGIGRWFALEAAIFFRSLELFHLRASFVSFGAHCGSLSRSSPTARLLASIKHRTGLSTACLIFCLSLACSSLASSSSHGLASSLPPPSTAIRAMAQFLHGFDLNVRLEEDDDGNLDKPEYDDANDDANDDMVNLDEEDHHGGNFITWTCLGSLLACSYYFSSHFCFFYLQDWI